MLEIKEQEISPVEENKPPREDLHKYHKRIDDLIEDAEIEAEMEAEKNIRSKNSRMFSISMIGIGLLGLVYFQVNHKTPPAPVESVKEAPVKSPETAEERLAKQVPVVEDGSIPSNLPALPSTKTQKSAEKTNPFLKPPKSKNITQPSKSKKITKTTNIKKSSQTPEPKTKKKKITSIATNKGSRFFIQAGAFSVKKNAESFLNQLKAKGFAPSIQTRSQKVNQHIVTVGNFANTKAGDGKLKELAGKGFKASYSKNPNNSFSLKVGQFNSLNDAQKLQDNLSVKGFLSESHKADAPAKTYIVQLGVFPNREKALLAQEKLSRAGYPKTFLR
jgi:cell division septation protein DedD